MLSSPITDEIELKSYEKVLHEFVNRLYGLGSVGQSVDDARLQAIVFGGRDFNNIPPSSDALHQKVMRAAYQAGHIWGNMFLKNPVLPPSSSWGFVQQKPEDIPRPLWSTKPKISRKNNKELSTCGCQSGECHLPCTCCRSKQTCTSLCGCQGMCPHTQTVLKKLSDSLNELDILCTQ